MVVDYSFIALVCTLVGAIIGFLTFSMHKNKEIKKEATNSAVITTKLDNIGVGVEAIRLDIRDNEHKVADLSDRLIRTEESGKQAHRRIDYIEVKRGLKMEMEYNDRKGATNE